MIGFILLACILLFFVMYGYHLFAKRDSAQHGSGAETAQCSVCSRPFPIAAMLEREKDAGIVHYFCGACIEQLYAEYSNRSQGVT